MHFLGLAVTINWRWVWLVVATFLAGVLNAVAGGGSFLSFPALLSMKILPVQANTTNTVAIWPGQLTSVAAYWPDVRKNARTAVLMGLAGLIGGTAGAIVLLNTPQMTFLHLVPWLLLVAASIFAVSGPVSRQLERLKRARHERAATAKARAAHPRHLALFLSAVVVSFYVGYFGAGSGFVFMTLLGLYGYEDIHVINALKVVANLLANGIAFVIFIVDGQVVWRYCLPALVAAAIGGYVSASMAKASSAASAARARGRDWAGDGGLVFLEELLMAGSKPPQRRRPVVGGPGREQRTEKPQVAAAHQGRSERGHIRNAAGNVC